MKEMKEFLRIVSRIMEQFDHWGKHDAALLDSMKETYEKLPSIERKQGLSLLSELLKEDYKSYLYFMSIFLTKLEEEEAVYYIDKMLLSKEPSLWERIAAMYQQKALLFRVSIVKDQQKAYQSMKAVYREILRDLAVISHGYSWIPWKDRRKSIALVVNQVLGMAHAPSRKMLSICRYFEELGYETMIYVSFFPGQTEKNHLLWYGGYEWNNQVEKTMPFIIATEEGEIRGHNLYLEEENFSYGIEKMADMIYSQRPEFVFELGDVTLVAGLCQAFTTVVTMGCTKMVPMTTAPVIARYFVYAKEDDEDYNQFLEKGQRVIDVKHKNIGESQLETVEKLQENAKNLRMEWGLSKEQFVILIVGNRLGSEIDDSFQRIICRILKENEKAFCVFVGKCEELQEKMKENPYKKQMLFLGYRGDFQEVIAMGDLFLNPPRQGGGTGALCAALAGIPVVTLNDCDVESTVGKSFVCPSMEEMPDLVSRYITDREFYRKRKKEIRENVEKELAVDSVGNFKKLCALVKEVTLCMEEAGENNYGK